jgi:hypothetical protein
MNTTSCAAPHGLGTPGFYLSLKLVFRPSCNICISNPRLQNLDLIKLLKLGRYTYSTAFVTQKMENRYFCTYVDVGYGLSDFNVL